MHPVILGCEPVIGSVYIDKDTMQTKVFDGKDWFSLTDAEAYEANHNITKEEYLLKKHPGLAQLKREADEAIEKYKAYYALCKE